MITISYFTLSFAVTLWLSRFLLNYVDTTYFLDHPSPRKIHDEPTPRFGGIAFGLTIIIIGWFLLNDQGQYTWYFLGAICIFILGVVDDYRTLSWRYKLPVQLFVGSMVAIQFIPFISQIVFFNVSLTTKIWFMFGLYLFWFVGILNAMNLIDGMDGLAGGYMILTAFGAMVIGWMSGAMDFVALNVIVLGAMMAFMIFNQLPAKYFMGDGGSILLGYHVAVMPLFFVNSSPNLHYIEIAPFLLLTAYLIIDTVRVFFVRVRHKQHPLTPDQNHLHHQLLYEGQSHSGTLVVIFLLTSISCIAAVFSVLVQYSLPLIVLYFTIMGLGAFVPKANEIFITFSGRMIKSFNKRKHTFAHQIKLPSIKIISGFVLLYFIGLILNSNGAMISREGIPLIMASFLIIVLFVLQSTSHFRRHEIVLVIMGLIQILLIDSGYGQNSTLPFHGLAFQLGTILRYAALVAIVLLTVLNYIIKSEKLSGEFWSTTDLLVLFLLIGLSSIHVLGFGIPVMMAFELGILYFANKLYIPGLLGSKESISEAIKA